MNKQVIRKYKKSISKVKAIISILLIGFLNLFIATSVFSATESIKLLRAGRGINSISRNNNVVSVILDSAYPNNNLKIGQKIVINVPEDASFNGTFVIATVTSQTVFTYFQTAANAAVAADSTGTAGGDYSDVILWESTEQRNLAANTAAVLECYNDWSGGYVFTAITGEFTISGWTTNGSDSYIKITVPPSERHKGVAGTGFRLVGTVIFTSVINFNSSANTIIEYLEIDGSNTTTRGIVVTGQWNNLSVVHDCLIYNISGGQTSAGGIILRPNGSSAYAYAYNNIIYNMTSRGIYFYGGDANTVAYCYNNTIYNFSREGGPDAGIMISNDSTPNVVAINNIVIGGSSTVASCFSAGTGTFHASSNYNITSDSSGPGANGAKYPSVASALTGVAFQSTTLGSENLHINSGSYARDHGVCGLAGMDIDGSLRGYNDTWDIGADEYTGGATAESVKLIRQTAAISSIRRSGNVVTVTLSESFPGGNLRLGQNICLSGITGEYVYLNGIYKISLMQIENQSMFYFNQNGPDITTFTPAGTPLAGGNYTTLSAWEAAERKDLVSAQQIAAAECYNDWPTGLTDLVHMEYWNTSATYYAKIYTPISERHTGKPFDGQDNYTGFAMRGNDLRILWLEQEHAVIQGIIFDAQFGSNRRCVDIADFGITFDSNICLNTTTNSAGLRVYAGSTTYPTKIINSIAYNCGRGFAFMGGSVAYCYNSTSANCGYGFYVELNAGNTAVLTNCLGYTGTGTAAFYRQGSNGTLTASYCASSDGTAAGDFAGTGNRINQIFTFMDTVTNDYRLVYNDAAAKNYGTNLSGDVNCPFFKDIDGDVRTNWDIGADETSTEFICNIRATGQANADYNLLSTWISLLYNTNDSISNNSWKVFSGTLTGTIADGANVTLYRNNSPIGPVGPALHVSKGNQILVRGLSGIISGSTTEANFNYTVGDQWRVDSTNYFTISDSGDSPIVVAECYNDWSGGLVQDAALGGLNLGGNEQHYYVIRTPLTERHKGTLESGFFIRTSGTGYAYFTPAGSYFKIQGIGIDSSASTYNVVYYFPFSSNAEGGEISNCIIKGNPAPASYQRGVFAISSTGRVIVKNIKFFNNIIYQCYRGIHFMSNGIGSTLTGLIYNNTTYNCAISGFCRELVGVNSTCDVVAINNIVIGGTTDFEGTFNATSNYNISGNNSAPGATNWRGVSSENIFANITSGSENLKLKSGVVAINNGADLSANKRFHFTKDINNDTRVAPWDIGADEYAMGFTITNMSAVQRAGTELIDITYTGTRTAQDASTLSYQASGCEYSLDNTNWSVMTRSGSGDATFALSPGQSNTYTWNAGADSVGTEDTTVWVRLTLADTNGNELTRIPIATPFAIDTRAPQNLANFRISAVTGNSVVLNWTAATDANFSRYDIWYGNNRTDVENRSGTATRWNNANDASLASAATTTTTIPITMNNSYYFKIWAIDSMGHEYTVATVASGSLTSLNVTPCDFAASNNGYMVNHIGNAAASLSLRQNMPANATIRLTFPLGFNVSGVTSATSANIDGTLTTAVSGQTVVVTRTTGSIIGMGATVSFTLNNVRNPNAFGNCGTYSLSIQDASNVYLEHAFELTGDNMIGFIFTAPISSTVWGVGETHAVTWTTANMNAPYTLEYEYLGAWVPAQNASGQMQVNLSGASAEWKIPGLSLGTTQRIRLRETSANPEGGSVLYDISSQFSISGGVALSAPNGGENWAVSQQHGIIWTENGTLPYGVILEYSNNGGSTWNNITGANNAGVTGISGSWQTIDYPQYNPDGSITQCYLWRPSDSSITNGDIDFRVRVRDANTSAPPAVDASTANFTVSSVIVNYTPPLRGNAGVAVGTTGQNISWSTIGVTNLRLEYYSNLAGSYQLIPGASSLAVGGGSFSWTVPDDVGLNNVNIRAVAVGANGAEATSGIEGSLSDTRDSPFTIFGALTRSTPIAGDYPVDDPTSRVPINWTGSHTLSAFTFETCTNLGVGVWTQIAPTSIFTTNTGSTNGYNWNSTTGVGLAYWQPTITGDIYYLRVRDSVDTDTASLATAGEFFRVTGLAINNVLPATPFDVGEVVTISGLGAGAATVRLLYANSLADAQNKTNCTTIDIASVVSSSWTRTWTIPNLISDTVYLRVENVANANIRNTSGPYSILGVVSVTSLAGSPWLVGQTNRTVAGTVTGTISAVRIEYSTNGSTWTTLNDASGQPLSALAVSGGAFNSTVTVPDAISPSFQVRAVDATGGRATSLCGVSSSTAAIAVRGALTIDTPGANFIVNRPETVTFHATGSLGSVRILYTYAATSNAAALDNWNAARSANQVVTYGVSSGGSGLTAVDTNYSWANVPDVVDELLDVVNSVSDGGIQLSTSNTSSNVYMKIRVEDADDQNNVYSVSDAFTCRYQYIAMRVIDPNGNPLSGIKVSENATLDPNKAAWEIATPTYSGNSLLASGPFRFYPYNGDATNDESYSTTFTRTDGGTDYPATASWRANSDKVIITVLDTAATANIAYQVKLNMNYDPENDAVVIASWLTKKGLMVTGISNPGSTEYDAAASLEVRVYDPMGTEMTTSNIALGVAADANGLFSGIIFDPISGITPGASYTIKAILTYRSVVYTGVDIFVMPTSFTYAVQATAVYNSARDSAIVNVWLDRSGSTMNRPGDLSLTVRDDTGVSVFDITYDGYDGPLDNNIDTHLLSNGVYTNIEWDPATTIAIGRVYTVEATVQYSSKSYRTYTSFSKSAADMIATDVAALRTDVAAVNTSVAAVNANVTTAVSDLAKVKTDISTTAKDTQTIVANVQTSTDQILTATQALPAKLDETKKEAELARKAEILNRETVVKTGSAIIIKYRTYPGLVPTITVYDPKNVTIVNAARMLETGGTGIYNYSLAFNSSWGLGDFTIVCNEATNGTMDATTITVVAQDIDSVSESVESMSGTVSAVLGEVSDMGDIKDAAAKIDSQVALIDTSIAKLTAGESGGSNLKGSSDLETLYKNISSLSEYIKTLNSAAELNIDKLIKVSDQRKNDLKYLRNKTEELKAAMDLSQKMIDNVANEPVVQMWYEFKE